MILFIVISTESLKTGQFLKSSQISEKEEV